MFSEFFFYFFPLTVWGNAGTYSANWRIYCQSSSQTAFWPFAKTFIEIYCCTSWSCEVAARIFFFRKCQFWRRGQISQANMIRVNALGGKPSCPTWHSAKAINSLSSSTTWFSPLNSYFLRRRSINTNTCGLQTTRLYNEIIVHTTQMKQTGFQSRNCGQAITGQHYKGV